MAAPRSDLSARISASRAVAAVVVERIIGGTAPIGRGAGAGGPIGKRLGPSQVTGRSQPGTRVATRRTVNVTGGGKAGRAQTGTRVAAGRTVEGTGGGKASERGGGTPYSLRGNRNACAVLPSYDIHQTCCGRFSYESEDGGRAREPVSFGGGGNG